MKKICERRWYYPDIQPKEDKSKPREINRKSELTKNALVSPFPPFFKSRPHIPQPPSPPPPTTEGLSFLNQEAAYQKICAWVIR